MDITSIFDISIHRKLKYRKTDILKIPVFINITNSLQEHFVFELSVRVRLKLQLSDRTKIQPRLCASSYSGKTRCLDWTVPIKDSSNQSGRNCPLWQVSHKISAQVPLASVINPVQHKTSLILYYAATKQARHCDFHDWKKSATIKAGTSASTWTNSKDYGRWRKASYRINTRPQITNLRRRENEWRRVLRSRWPWQSISLPRMLRLYRR